MTAPVPPAAAPANPFRTHASPSADAPREPEGFTEQELEMLEAQHQDIATLKGDRERDPKRYFEIVIKLSAPAWKVYLGNFSNEARRPLAADLLLRSTVVAVYWQGQKVLDEKRAKPALDAVLNRLPRLPVAENTQAIISKLYGDVAPAEEKG